MSKAILIEMRERLAKLDDLIEDAQLCVTACMMEADSKETKWKAGPYRVKRGTEKHSPRIVAPSDHSGGEFIAIVCGGGEDQADLFAAAPDLYAALEMLLPDAEEYMRRTLSGSPAAIEMARAALAKARGESHDATK